MNCLECQELLQKRLDGERIAVSGAFDTHLGECAACRELHAGAAVLLDGLKQIPSPIADFAQSMTRQVMQERRQRRDKMRRRIYLTVALAASVLLMLVLAYQWLPRPEKLPGPGIAKDPHKNLPVPKNVPEAKKTEQRNALAALTDRLADTTRDHAQVVLVGTNLDAVEKLPVNELPMSEAGQEVSDGVRTVTRNARRAIDFFTRELPMPEMGEQKN